MDSTVQKVLSGKQLISQFRREPGKHLCMGNEADNVLGGLKLTDSDQRLYSKIQDGLQSLFIVEKNVVYKRARFNMRESKSPITLSILLLLPSMP